MSTITTQPQPKAQPKAKAQPQPTQPQPKAKVTATTVPNAGEQAAAQIQAKATAVSILRNEGDTKAATLLLFVLLVRGGILKVTPSKTKAGRYVLRGVPKVGPAVAGMVTTYLTETGDKFVQSQHDHSELQSTIAKGSNLTRLLAFALAYLPNATTMPLGELSAACRDAIVAGGGNSPITEGARLLKTQPTDTNEPNEPTQPKAKLPKADECNVEQHAQFLQAQFAMLANYASKYGIPKAKVAAMAKAAFPSK